MTPSLRLPLVLVASLAFALSACGRETPECGEPGGRCPDACGNGQVESGEACDDGNQTAADGCEPDCTPTPSIACGNGELDDGEICDDGNAASGDGCEAGCTPTPLGVCGNGAREMGEACDDGNSSALDGCETDCTATAVEVHTCPWASDPPPEPGPCEVAPGDANRLITGTILTAGHVYVGGQVLFDAQGVIQCVGCDCTASGGSSATHLRCSGSIVSPGLINAHDHLTFQGSPFVPTTDERYEHRHDWRVGNDGHTVVTNGGSSTTANQQWGELRQLMSGTTSIAGSGGPAFLARNLDSASNSGLSSPAVEYDTFPLGDSNGTERVGRCDYPSLVAVPPVTPPPDAGWLPHIAEGIEASARNELLCMSSATSGGLPLVDGRTAIVHGIGVRAADVARIRMFGAGLVWSPRSNVALYGDTAPIAAYDRAGVPIALGTDWLRSGSMNLLRELQCADSLNRSYFGGFLRDEELWMAVTATAADVLEADRWIGRLAVGKFADIAIFRGRDSGSVYRAVIDAQPQDVVVTLRQGKPLFGDPAIVAMLTAETCEAIDVCGAARVACVGEISGTTLATLVAANAGRYPLFECADPANEPTCTPMRAEAWTANGSNAYSGALEGTDTDGDGIADGQDNCPRVFNPIRPLDDGAQGDVDLDGAGDACDVCPLDPFAATCTPIAQNDLDGDRVPDAQDNCAFDSNPDQADAEGDGVGDRCDWCPSSNPGGAACPASIYDVKTPKAGELPFRGHAVALTRVQVTAVGPTGFFVQVPEDDPAFSTKGSDYSGLFVFTSGSAAQRGDLIDVAGTLQDYFGQLQLTQVTALEVRQSGRPDPAPVVAPPPELTTGGARAAALEGVLVRVEDVEVTDLNPPPGPGETPPTFEFVVNGALRVNDYLHRLTPPAQLAETFASITGPLEWRNGNFKIEPRFAEDIVGGAATLAAFGPGSAFAREGVTGPTFPDALQVFLVRPVAEATTISILSSSPDLTVTGGAVVVPAGAMSAAIEVTGVAQNGAVTLTAEIGTASLAATVRVLGANEQPVLVAVSPNPARVPQGGTANVRVELDIPPAADLAIDLALAPSAFGTVPATVVVPANKLYASVPVTADAAATGVATLTATLGTDSASTELRAQPGRLGLIVNEVDYDQPGIDFGEFVELFNSSNEPIDVRDVAIAFFNGANGSEYRRVQLGSLGSIAAGEYVVIGSANARALVPAGVRTLAFGGNQDQIENARSATGSGAPDGLAILDTSSGTVLDSLAYEGALSVTINGVSHALNEGAGSNALADTGAGSLSRALDGVDTDDNVIDYAFVATATPGTAN